MQPTHGGSHDPIVPLPWDSSHFGFSIGRILWNGVAGELRSVLSKARADGYRLLYVYSPVGSDIREESAGIASRVLETRRLELTKRLPPTAIRTSAGLPIRRLDEGFADLPAIRRLGVIAGGYSRFFRDHSIDRHAAESLFAEWAEKSLRGVLADITYGCFSPGNELAAFLALRGEPAGARITLLSVMPEYQGRGYGTALMRQAEELAVDRGMHLLLVATTAENTGAVAFYRKRGFSPTMEQMVAHVWLE